jgi:hypothetical protein
MLLYPILFALLYLLGIWLMLNFRWRPSRAQIEEGLTQIFGIIPGEIWIVLWVVVVCFGALGVRCNL